MSTKLKDKKIKIYMYIETTDEDGFDLKAYMPIHPQDSVWAYFKQLSASLLYASNTTTIKEECLFRINYTDAILQNHANDYFVYYDGMLFQCTRVDPYEGYKRDLVLYCKLTTEKISTIIPYDETKLPTLTDFTVMKFNPKILKDSE